MRRLLASAIALALCTAVLWADTTVFTDTFTEASTTALPSHVCDSGAPCAWTLNEDTSSGVSLFRANATDIADVATSTVSARVSYYATPTIALGSADYYVQYTLVNVADSSADDFAYIILRRTAVDNYYGCGWYAAAAGGSDGYVFKYLSGGPTFTSISNVDINPADGDVMKCAVVGDTITLYKNGASVISGAGGSSILSVGAGGFGMGNIRSATDDITTSLQIDDFSIVETTAAGSSGGGAFQLLLQAWRALADGWARA